MSVLRSWLLCALVVVGVVGCGGGGGGGKNASTVSGSSGGENISGGGSTSTPATAPSISGQPNDLTVGDGSSALFMVHFNGTSPMSVQWKKNGIAILGATGISYEIGSVTMADEGAEFTATISNSAGSVTSTSATLSVYSVGPSIVTAPQTQMILAGTTATFNAVATGTPPLAFQWRKNGALISGATSASYTTPVATPLYNGAVYDVLVTNAVGTVLSPTATLQVTSVPNAVTLTTQPINASVTEGNVATFSVAATGTGPFTYQWFKNGVPIPGGYQATLNIAPATALDNGAQIYAEVSNSLGTSISNTANLTIAKDAISLLLGRIGNWGNIDGPAELAQFGSICGVALDGAGNYFVSDGENHTIRRISALKAVTTFAGLSQQSGTSDGIGANARFEHPGAITMDGFSNIYLIDTANQTVRKITSSGSVTTLAGSPGNSGALNGTGSAALFDFEQNYIACSIFGQSGIAADNSGTVYVADSNNHAIRKIAPDGTVTTFAGALGQPGVADGPAGTARFNHPTGVALDSMQNLYVIDRSPKIRKISPTGEVTSLTGNMPSLPATDGPLMVASDGEIFFSSYSTIYKYSSSGGASTLAGSYLDFFKIENGVETAASFGVASGLAPSLNGEIVVADTYGLRLINRFNQVSTFAGNLGPTYGYLDGLASMAQTRTIGGIASDNLGNVYFSDRGNHSVRKLTASGIVSTIAGAYQEADHIDGSSSAARFNSPSGIARDASGNLYLSDDASHTIRKIASDGTVSTIAGDPDSPGFEDGATEVSRLNNPGGVAVDSSANVYFVDKNNFVIRKITPTGIVSTLAGMPGVPGAANGTGNIARFSNPSHIAVDSSDNLYVSDNFSVRKVTPAGAVTTFAGSPSTFGTSDGTGSAARFSFPHGIAIDTDNNLYIADGGNNGTIRKITPAAVVSTVVGTAGSWGMQLGSLPGSLGNPQTVAIAPSISGTKLYVSDNQILIHISLP